MTRSVVFVLLALAQSHLSFAALDEPLLGMACPPQGFEELTRRSFFSRMLRPIIRRLNQSDPISSVETQTLDTIYQRYPDVQLAAKNALEKNKSYIQLTKNLSWILGELEQVQTDIELHQVKISNEQVIDKKQSALDLQILKKRLGHLKHLSEVQGKLASNFEKILTNQLMLNSIQAAYSVFNSEALHQALDAKRATEEIESIKDIQRKFIYQERKNFKEQQAVEKALTNLGDPLFEMNHLESEKEHDAKIEEILKKDYSSIQRKINQGLAESERKFQENIQAQQQNRENLAAARFIDEKILKSTQAVLVTQSDLLKSIRSTREQQQDLLKRVAQDRISSSALNLAYNKMKTEGTDRSESGKQLFIRIKELSQNVLEKTSEFAFLQKKLNEALLKMEKLGAPSVQSNQSDTQDKEGKTHQDRLREATNSQLSDEAIRLGNTQDKIQTILRRLNEEVQEGLSTEKIQSDQKTLKLLVDTQELQARKAQLLVEIAEKNVRRQEFQARFKELGNSSTQVAQDLSRRVRELTSSLNRESQDMSSLDRELKKKQEKLEILFPGLGSEDTQSSGFRSHQSGVENDQSQIRPNADRGNQGDLRKSEIGPNIGMSKLGELLNSVQEMAVQNLKSIQRNEVLDVSKAQADQKVIIRAQKILIDMREISEEKSKLMSAAVEKYNRSLTLQVNIDRLKRDSKEEIAQEVKELKTELSLTKKESESIVKQLSELDKKLSVNQYQLNSIGLPDINKNHVGSLSPKSKSEIFGRRLALEEELIQMRQSVSEKENLLTIANNRLSTVKKLKRKTGTDPEILLHMKGIGLLQGLISRQKARMELKQKELQSEGALQHFKEALNEASATRAAAQQLKDLKEAISKIDQELKGTRKKILDLEKVEERDLKKYTEYEKSVLKLLDATIEDL